MKIGSVQPLSLSDFPPYTAAIIFTIGCNLRCSYCHNKNLWGDNFHPIDPQEALTFLDGRKKLLDGVVITGGEPTIQKQLIPFTQKIKNLGYKIKLNTNGVNPKCLEELLNKKLLDYIAMDIKGPFDLYEQLCGVAVLPEDIKKSIDLISGSGLPHEFRTVFDKTLLKEADIATIKAILPKNSTYIITQLNF
ncbi:MAG: anaerobic ribonucleoside-triphosphate reductase activating protein [Gammaproteobacteria bacterium]|nr:anaerobic ribonucleoside-triphosphate reductase activating protein [Gammaproteobacteria bacterium]